MRTRGVTVLYILYIVNMLYILYILYVLHILYILYNTLQYCTVLSSTVQCTVRFGRSRFTLTWFAGYRLPAKLCSASDRARHRATLGEHHTAWTAVGRTLVLTVQKAECSASLRSHQSHAQLQRRFLAASTALEAPTGRYRHTCYTPTLHLRAGAALSR